MLIEPGAIQTPLWDKTLALVDELDRSLSIEGRQRYGALLKAVRKSNEHGKAAGIPADRVASVIESALTSTRPRARYLVGKDAKMLATLTRLLPGRLLDQVILKQAAPSAGALSRANRHLTKGLRGARCDEERAGKGSSPELDEQRGVPPLV